MKPSLTELMETYPMGFVEFRRDTGPCPHCDGEGFVEIEIVEHWVGVTGAIGTGDTVVEKIRCISCNATGRVYEVIRKEFSELDTGN